MPRGYCLKTCSSSSGGHLGTAHSAFASRTLRWAGVSACTPETWQVRKRRTSTCWTPTSRPCLTTTRNHRAAEVRPPGATMVKSCWPSSAASWTPPVWSSARRRGSSSCSSLLPLSPRGQELRGPRLRLPKCRAIAQSSWTPGHWSGAPRPGAQRLGRAQGHRGLGRELHAEFMRPAQHRAGMVSAAALRCSHTALAAGRGPPDHTVHDQLRPNLVMRIKH
mmetsp:Transcript_441/g.1357  ORF Transcript_441/g.1357 Transcript_441/m.1357 type:complete len:221 (+) Transcript_441:363-1025(+)